MVLTAGLSLAAPARMASASAPLTMGLGAQQSKLAHPGDVPKTAKEETDGLEFTYLRQYFGHETFRSGQHEVVKAALAGRDVAVFWATGAGKSLCYQLPALQTGKIVLIISPLISLMVDQVTKFNATVGAAGGNHTACFLGTAQKDPQIEQQALAGQHRLVYLTPEKLTMGSFVERLKPLYAEKRLALLAIDEAHCISEWGHDFRPAYRSLRNIREALPDLPIMALTATAVPRVQADIVEQLSMRQDRLQSSNSFDRPNLKIGCIRKQNKDADLRKIANDIAQKKGSTIVYAPTQGETESVAAALSQHLAPHKMSVLCYHGGLTPDIRENAHFAFLSGAAHVIVATVAFGMGIDKPDIRRIVHYGPPKTVEEYFQQIGRAGRDGCPSVCEMIAADTDFSNYASDFYTKGLTQQAREQQLKSTDALRKFAGGTCGCRRRWLLEYFGEVPSWGAQCGTCDLCMAAVAHGTDSTRDFRQAVAPILEAVALTQGFPQGITSLLTIISGCWKPKNAGFVNGWQNDVLMAKDRMKAIRDALPRVMKTEATTREMLSTLVSTGFLERQRVSLQNTGRDFGNSFDTFKMTAKGEKARNGKEEVRLAVPQTVRQQEEEALRRTEARAIEIQKAGFDPKQVPQKELDDDEGGPLLWYVRKLEHWRQSGKESLIKNADNHEELRKRINAWRDSTAQALRMAPADVLPEHVIVKLAYVKPTTVDALRGAGVRIVRVEELADVMAKSKDELFGTAPEAVDATGENAEQRKPGVMVLPQGIWTPPMQWPKAVYKPAKGGAKSPWEVSYDRFSKGESMQAIAMNQQKKPIQVATVLGHICQAIAFQKPVDLDRVVRESEKRLPNESEWDRIEAAATERNVNVDADDYKARDILAAILGSEKVNRDPTEKSEADKEEEAFWYGLIRWWEPLKKVRFQATFEDPAKRQRTA